MPRRFANPRLQAEWGEIIRDYEASGELVAFRLILGDTDYGYIESATLGADSGSLPWTLDTQLSDRIPMSLINAPVRLFCEIAGDQMMLFKGEASYPAPSSEWTTNLTSLTSGHWMDKATLDEPVDINGETPESAIRNALYRVPYDRARVNVYPWQTPLIYRLRNVALPPEDVAGSWAGGFERTDVPKSILDSLLAEVRGVSIDHPLDGNMTIPDPGVGEGQDIVWDYEADSKEVLEPFVTPSWAAPDEQYTRVVVQSLLEDGTDRIPPAEWIVDYSGMPYPPRVGRTLYIDLSDQTVEAEMEARDLAVKAARNAGKGLWTGDTVVAFNPFLLPYDCITMGHYHEDSTGVYRRLYRCIITSLSHNLIGETLATNLGFNAVVLQNERLPDTPIILPGLSAGNVKTPGTVWQQNIFTAEWSFHTENLVKYTYRDWIYQDSGEAGEWLFDQTLVPAGMFAQEAGTNEWLVTADVAS